MSSSLISIQKPRSKRATLPKSSLIQLFIENSSDELISRCSESKPRLFPKLDNQDLMKQVTQMQEEHPSTTEDNIKNVRNSLTQSLKASTTLSPNTTQVKKCFKDNKIKQITRLCLYQAEQAQNHEKNYLNDENNLNDTLENLNQLSVNQYRNKQNLLKHLSKEFLIDCRQRLDFNTFKHLLDFLVNCKLNENFKYNPNTFDNNLKLLEGIHTLIKNDLNLCNKFSAFLTVEYAIHFNLFMQSAQYEKTYNFLQKLEIFNSNKCTFKKLLQSISASSNLSLESDTFKTKIDEIKMKIKSSTKNNELINDELDYLFDQRCANLQPAYENVSLVDMEPSHDKENDFKLKHSIQEEFIDLTNNLSCANKTKKPVNNKLKFKNNIKAEKSNSKVKFEKDNKFVISLKKLDE